METCKVNICYRPMRIAWAVHSGDFEAVRRAVRLSNAFWGGRYNPIVFADRPDEAKRLVEVFRVDHIIALGQQPQLQTLRKEFSHLIDPFFGDELFVDRENGQSRSYLLDVHNVLAYWSQQSDWKSVTDRGFRRIIWHDADPLSDGWLFQFGAFPTPDEIGIDYASIIHRATMAVDFAIDAAAPVPDGIFAQTSVAHLNRYGLYRHHAVRAGREHPGFYVGDVSNTEDLVAFWNLRAADVPLLFVDLAHIQRYERILPGYKADFQARVAHEPEPFRHLAIWARNQDTFDAARAALGEEVRTFSRVVPELWNGLNVVPPMMILGDASALGVVSESVGRPSVAFSLNEKPFSSDPWFYTQHLVASLSIYGAADEQHTFLPPYVPELNEMAARTMYFDYNKVRLEPDRVGVIVDAADNDITLRALRVSELIESIFKLANLSARPSNSGLMTRQLVARMGGYDDCRAFKIPGVRRLIKTYGPNATFSKSAALQTIGRPDPVTGARFSDHERLYIEPRPSGPLTQVLVFEHLVAKGLFRIGVDLTCPSCNLPSWFPLDNLKQNNTCELCGNSHDFSRQLVKAEFSYRRTGILGIEKNTQGAIPVALLLQQLSANLRGVAGRILLAPSYDLKPINGAALPECETDFVGIYTQSFPDAPVFIVGECKDEGDRIDQGDVDNLRAVADAIPKRFETFILLARLSPFSQEEIALAASLNERFRRRAILVSARELEPYHIYDRVNAELGTRYRGMRPQDLADVTAKVYFSHS